MKSVVLPEPELSRPLGVDKIPAGGMTEHIVARPVEREGLAKRFGLVEMKRFEAWLTIDHAEGKMVEVTGKLSADLVQTCVVTLETFSVKVEETLDVLFAPERLLAQTGAGAPHADGSPESDPEPIVNGVIDLGELAAQHLGVALDPYPRKPGAQLQAKGLEGEEKSTVKPFSNLASMWRDKQGKGDK